MVFTPPSLTLGVEEEYLLVDPETRNLAVGSSDGMLTECHKQLGDRVSPEFLTSQLEVGTSVCRNIAEVRAELGDMRRTVVEIAKAHDLAMIAASTHPFARWEEQTHTDKDRYNMLAEDLQAVARRLLICGMHVHVGIEDDDLRVELMNQLTYFLPHLVVLSTSSPFWHGEDTGLKSYRLCVWDELPRTGLPEQFESFGEYQRHVAALVEAGLIPDGTMLWWDIRPSARFQTLEMRITDICTRLDDAICVAAIFVCIVRMLVRLRGNNQRWRAYSRMLVDENRWRAQRYGTDEGLVDFGKGKIVGFAELLEELIVMIREDAEELGCLNEVLHARDIVAHGTSAHRQLADYHGAIAAGETPENALKKVVDGLIAETVSGL
jgi:carboxylate-amine ligase